MSFYKMKFAHNLIDLPLLERTHLPSGRFYKTPEGNLYPSVTTVLGEMGDKTALDNWKKRIGKEEAERQSKYAANRGTIVHELCEKLILNEEVSTRGLMPIPISLYNQFKRQLEANVDNIRGSELYLYSDKLKVAGAADLFADWNSVPSTIDYKTSGKLKKKEWIEGYFLQTSLYSYMLWERTGVVANQLVIIIAVEMEKEAQVFIEDARNWIPKARDFCRAYHLKFT